MLAGRFADAYRFAVQAYLAAEQAQPLGHRVHKGAWAMQAGVAQLNLGEERDGAYRWVLAAFAEDALSRGEESPNAVDELSRPAAFSLLFNFGVPGPLLARLAIGLRQRQHDGALWRDARDALRERWARDLLRPTEEPRPTANTQIGQAAALIETAPQRVASWRIPGNFGTRFEERVFVGGVYSDALLGTLVAIRDEVRRHGLDGVVAAEFKRDAATAETMYADAMLLLRSCRSAVFEMSDDRGNMQEFERADQFDVRNVLVVRNATADPPSVMVTGKCARMGWPIDEYGGPEELQSIVSGWLDGLGFHAPG